MRFSQTTWTTRLVALVLCPVAGGVINVLRHLTTGSGLVQFVSGYAFAMLACALLGGWLHFSDGHDLLGRRVNSD